MAHSFVKSSLGLVTASLPAISSASVAVAAERTFGPKTCYDGPVYTSSRSTGNTMHTHYQGAVKKSRSWNNGETYTERNFYGGLSMVSSARVGTDGYLTESSIGCDW